MPRKRRVLEARVSDFASFAVSFDDLKVHDSNGRPSEPFWYLDRAESLCDNNSLAGGRSSLWLPLSGCMLVFVAEEVEPKSRHGGSNRGARAPSAQRTMEAAVRLPTQVQRGKFEAGILRLTTRRVRWHSPDRRFRTGSRRRLVSSASPVSLPPAA
jgi:hypothetical protein